MRVLAPFVALLVASGAAPGWTERLPPAVPRMPPPAPLPVPRMPPPAPLPGVPAPAAPGADDPEGAQRRALEAKVRAAEPRDRHEVARQAANDRLVALLGTAGSMELVRLDPKSGGPDRPDAFHGYEVLRRVPVVRPADRAELAASLGRELHWLTDLRAACFSPRHGLRATIGPDVVDLVICFECSWVQVYRNGAQVDGAPLVGRRWEPAERLLRRPGPVGGP